MDIDIHYIIRKYSPEDRYIVLNMDLSCRIWFLEYGNSGCTAAFTNLTAGLQTHQESCWRSVLNKVTASHTVDDVVYYSLCTTYHKYLHILFYSTLLSSILFYSILFYSILFYSVIYICYFLFYYIILYYIVFYSIILYCIIFFSIILNYIILYYIILYYIILYYIILYYIILYYIILYYII